MLTYTPILSSIIKKFDNREGFRLFLDLRHGMVLCHLTVCPSYDSNDADDAVLAADPIANRGIAIVTKLWKMTAF